MIAGPSLPVSAGGVRGRLRVLMVVQHLPPDAGSTGRLAAHLGRCLVERGHDVSVVTTFPQYRTFRVWPEHRGRLHRRDALDGMRVDRVWSFANGHMTARSRACGSVTFAIGAGLAGHLAARACDAVLVVTGPGTLLAGASAWLAAGRRPFAIGVHGASAEGPLPGGRLPGPAAIRALGAVERLALARAGAIAVTSPRLRDSLLLTGLPDERVAVVPDLVDTGLVRPLPRDNPVGRRLGLTGRFVVAHVGPVGYGHDLDTVLDAACRLRARPDVLFLVAGDGVARPGLQARATTLGLSNVRFLPRRPPEEVPWLRAACDVQLALRRAGARPDPVPARVCEIMASGRPALAASGPGDDVGPLLGRTGAGLCVPPGDAAQLADAVLRLRDDPAERERMGRRGRCEAVANHAPDVVASRYEAILARLVERR